MIVTVAISLNFLYQQGILMCSVAKAMFNHYKYNECKCEVSCVAIKNLKVAKPTSLRKHKHVLCQHYTQQLNLN